MYCSKCKHSSIDITEKRIIDLDEKVEIYYFGICPTCSELVGSVEVFEYSDWDFLPNEKAKEIFEKGVDKPNYL